MVELERTYLVKKFPDNLKNYKFKEIIDIYIPKSSDHPKIRIRKNGDRFEMTKKEPVIGGDASHQEEQTIVLTENEFMALNNIEGKRVRKLRYEYDYNRLSAEVDVFQDDLNGLVLIDFEFATIKEKDSFEMPDFCLADVTQETFVAGGMVCGKSYADIENGLNTFGYKKLFLE